MWNKLVFTGDEWYQSIVATTRFEKGRLTEIRLHPVDLSYTARGADRGVPRLATPEVARSILERLQRLSQPFGDGDRDRTGHRRHPPACRAIDCGETVAPRLPIIAMLSQRSRRLIAQLSLGAALVSGCGGPDAAPAAPREVRFPNPDVGADTLEARKQAQLETASQFAVFHDFQFTDRVKESGITFVHHIVEDAGKHYKAVHYDHGNGIAVADVDGDGLHDIYFVNQVGGNELWRNLGGGKFENITDGSRRRRWPTRSASPPRSPTSTTTAIRTCSSRPFAAGTCCSRTTDTATSRTSPQTAGVDLRRPFVGRRVLRLRPRRPASTCSWCNVGQYTTDTIGGADGVLRRPRGRVSGPHASGPRRAAASSIRNTADNHFKDVTARDRAADRPAGAATPASSIPTSDGWPDLYVLNMQGDEQYFENAGRAHVRRQDRAVLSQDALGRDGDQVLRLRQRRPPGSLRHRHALGHVRDHAAGP